MNFGIDGGVAGGLANDVGQVTTGRLTETLVAMPAGAVEVVVVVDAVALVVVFGTVVSCGGAFADDCPDGLLDGPELAR